MTIEAGDPRAAFLLAAVAPLDATWTERRSPDSVRALLEAGPLARDVPLPSGYAECDEPPRRSRVG